MKSRFELIREIAQFRKDIRKAKAEIQKYPWDCDEELYVLKRSDVLKVFERYLSGEISEDELIGWASFLECRDDLGYEKGWEDILDKVIFWIGNPEINFPVNVELVEKLRKQISANET
jgi:hypothetical protein